MTNSFWIPRLSLRDYCRNLPIINLKIIRVKDNLDRSVSVPFINIVAIAIALAMDAFAVSIAAGVTLKNVSFRQGFRLSWHFGLFQAMMPIIGWGAGLSIRTFIESYDHWIAFGLLVFVGGNMIREAFEYDRKKRKKEKKDPTKGLTLIVLSVATSIDALAVGLSISVLKISIWTPAVIIGVVACGFTIAGLHIGKRIGSAARVSRNADLMGGLVLIGIGLKILHEHGVLDLL